MDTKKKTKNRGIEKPQAIPNNTQPPIHLSLLEIYPEPELPQEQDEQEKLNKKLLGAVWRGDAKGVRTSLNLGAKVDMIVEIGDTEGWTALMWAVGLGHTEICKLLIEHGADVNIQDNEGYTALMRVAKEGYIETTKYLLSVGANPLLENNDRENAYKRAGKAEIKQIIKIFENLWKKLGEEQTLLLMQNVNSAVRNCSPDKMYSIFVNL